MQQFALTEHLQTTTVPTGLLRQSGSTGVVGLPAAQHHVLFVRAATSSAWQVYVGMCVYVCVSVSFFDLYGYIFVYVYMCACACVYLEISECFHMPFPSAFTCQIMPQARGGQAEWHRQQAGSLAKEKQCGVQGSPRIQQ